MRYGSLKNGKGIPSGLSNTGPTGRTAPKSVKNPTNPANIKSMKRKHTKKIAAAVALSGILLSAVANAEPAKPDIPSDADLARVTGGKDKLEFIDRLLTLVEKEIVPLTQEGVRKGNKLFGAAVLKKSDLSTVIAGTNTETGNPLMHGEVTAIFNFYDVPRDKRPPAKETIFFCTHEPCPLCLSSITWGGWDNFFYLFSYEDTKDAFNIPHDIRMNQEIFRLKDAQYARKNHYWSSWGLRDLIADCDEEDRKRFEARLKALRKTYDEMSEIYQKSKGGDAEIPLK